MRDFWGYPYTFMMDFISWEKCIFAALNLGMVYKIAVASRWNGVYTNYILPKYAAVSSI